ncbi:MAG: hypothetical protein MR749_08910 [Succinatimonas hippei]|nr:hypothetical protein [Succinatimonas hippei]
MELKTVFIDNNSDMECLNTISKSLPSEVLEKAFDSSKLVQRKSQIRMDIERKYG